MNALRGCGAVLVSIACMHCAGSPVMATSPLASRAVLDNVDMVRIAGGASIAGSTSAEREAAYQASLATSGTDSARANHWFDVEAAPHTVMLGDFSIDRRH